MAVAVTAISRKIEEMGLELAVQKTETVILTGPRRLRSLTLRVEGYEVVSQPALKYMGVWLDRGMRMMAHVRKTYEKANRIVSALTRITPRVRGPTASKKRMLATVVLSTILYAAPIWEGVTRYAHYRALLERLNRRMALRVTAAYRTAPTEAVLVLAGLPPIDLQIKERVLLHKFGRTYKTQARRIVMGEWSQRWSGYTGWAKRFIVDPRSWWEGKVAESDHFLSQAVTGHGSFGAYLCRIGRATTPSCVYCEEEDTPSHTLFSCGRWEVRRAETEMLCGTAVTEANVGAILARGGDERAAVAGMLRDIMAAKYREEIARGRVGADRGGGAGG